MNKLQNPNLGLADGDFRFFRSATPLTWGLGLAKPKEGP